MYFVLCIIHYVLFCVTYIRYWNKARGQRGVNIHQILAEVYTTQVSARQAPKVLVITPHPTGRDPVVWPPDSRAEATQLLLFAIMPPGEDRRASNRARRSLRER